jgi:hypothetical protein
MKTKLLGLMAFVSLLGLSPANATTYQYSVYYAIGPATVTGFIDTDCNTSCVSTTSDITAWSFVITGPSSYSLSGSSPAFTDGDLEITPSTIFYTPLPSSFGTGFYNPGISGLCFDLTASDCVTGTGFNDDGYFSVNNLSTSSTAYSESSLPIATMTTPIPGALALFATVVVAGGLLGWRRNRKNAAAIAAA